MLSLAFFSIYFVCLSSVRVLESREHLSQGGAFHGGGKVYSRGRCKEGRFLYDLSL